MSTDKTDTTFTVLDGGAGKDDSNGESEKAIPSTEKVNDEAVVVSPQELEALGGLLETFKNILLGHEVRLNNAEARVAALEEKTGGSAIELPEHP